MLELQTNRLQYSASITGVGVASGAATRSGAPPSLRAGPSSQERQQFGQTSCALRPACQRKFVARLQPQWINTTKDITNVYLKLPRSLYSLV